MVTYVRHCPQGHFYTPDNVYYDKRGHRYCKTCAREKSLANYYRKRDAKPPLIGAEPKHRKKERHENTEAAKRSAPLIFKLCLVDECYEPADQEKLCAHHLKHRDDRTDPHSDFIRPLSKARLMGCR
jgi:hypothetical protein